MKYLFVGKLAQGSVADITLADVEQALILASNRLQEAYPQRNEIDGVGEDARFLPLDTVIDDALRLVQAWREEAGI